MPENPRTRTDQESEFSLWHIPGYILVFAGLIYLAPMLIIAFIAEKMDLTYR